MDNYNKRKSVLLFLISETERFHHQFIIFNYYKKTEK